MKGVSLFISISKKLHIFMFFAAINAEAGILSCVKDILKLDLVFPNEKVKAAALMIRTGSRSKELTPEEGFSDLISRWIDARRLSQLEKKATPLDLNNHVLLNTNTKRLEGAYDVNQLGLDRRYRELKNRKGFASANTKNIRNQEQLDFHLESVLSRFQEIVKNSNGNPINVTELISVIEASFGRLDMRLHEIFKEYGIERVNFVSPEKWMGLRTRNTEATILKTYPSGQSSVQLEVLGTVPQTKEEMALWVGDFLTDLHEAVRIQVAHRDNENIKKLGAKEAKRLLDAKKFDLIKLDQRVYTSVIELRNYLNQKAKLDPEFNSLGLPEAGLGGTGWYRFKLAAKTISDVALGDVSDAAAWAVGKLSTRNPVEENRASLAWFSKDGIAIERLKEQKQRESWKLYQIFRKYWEKKGIWLWRTTAAVALTVLWLNREARVEVQEKMTDRKSTPTTLTQSMRNDSNPILQRENEKLNKLKAERDKAQLENDSQKVTELEDQIDTVLAGIDAITGAK